MNKPFKKLLFALFLIVQGQILKSEIIIEREQGLCEKIFPSMEKNDELSEFAPEEVKEYWQSLSLIFKEAMPLWLEIQILSSLINAKSPENENLFSYEMEATISQSESSLSLLTDIVRGTYQLNNIANTQKEWPQKAPHPSKNKLIAMLCFAKAISAETIEEAKDIIKQAESAIKSCENINFTLKVKNLKDGELGLKIELFRPSEESPFYSTSWRFQLN